MGELSLAKDTIARGAQKVMDMYDNIRATRTVEKAKRVAQTAEAAQKGGLFKTWNTTKRVGRGLGRAAGVAYGASVAYDIGKALYQGDPVEAGKIGFREAVTYGAYALPARIPYVGPAITGGLIVADASRLVRGKQPLVSDLLDSIAPGLRPKSYEETPEDIQLGETDDRAEEPIQQMMQPAPNYPSERDMRKTERRQRLRQAARQRGLEMIAQYNAEAYR
jgi:hypothetical protein